MKDTGLLKKQIGFTLIELVVVIVILGILSAVALPKYIDLTSDSKGAVLKHISGSLMSAHDLVYTKSIIQNNLGDLNGKTELSSGDIDVHYGHARTHWTITWEYIMNIDAEGKANGSKTEVCNSNQEFCAVYNVKHGSVGYNNDWTVYILPIGYAVNDNCYARYTLDVLTTTPHLVETNAVTTGC